MADSPRWAWQPVNSCQIEFDYVLIMGWPVVWHALSQAGEFRWLLGWWKKDKGPVGWVPVLCLTRHQGCWSVRPGSPTRATKSLPNSLSSGTPAWGNRALSMLGSQCRGFATGCRQNIWGYWDVVCVSMVEWWQSLEWRCATNSSQPWDGCSRQRVYESQLLRLGMNDMSSGAV